MRLFFKFFSGVTFWARFTIRPRVSSSDFYGDRKSAVDGTLRVYQVVRPMVFPADWKNCIPEKEF